MSEDSTASYENEMGGPNQDTSPRKKVLVFNEQGLVRDPIPPPAVVLVVASIDQLTQSAEPTHIISPAYSGHAWLPPVEDGAGVLKRTFNYLHYATRTKDPTGAYLPMLQTDSVNTFFKGFMGGFLLSMIGKYTLEHFLQVPPMVVDFSAVAGFGMVLGAGPIRRLIEGPADWQRFKEKNPRYWPGLEGVMSGATLGAGVHFVYNYVIHAPK